MALKDPLLFIIQISLTFQYLPPSSLNIKVHAFPCKIPFHGAGARVGCHLQQRKVLFVLDGEPRHDAANVDSTKKPRETGEANGGKKGRTNHRRFANNGRLPFFNQPEPMTVLAWRGLINEDALGNEMEYIFAILLYTS